MISLCNFDETFLELSYSWLHDEEMKYLTDTPDFSKEDQLEWFKNLEKKTDYKIWGIRFNDTPIGACGMKNISEGSCEFWGYIGEKQFRGKGYGWIMLDQIVQIAADSGLSEIWLRVRKYNNRAIRLYKKAGFITESESENEMIMRKNLKLDFSNTRHGIRY